jgi:apolipoprotein N-acyltransferase
MSLGIAVFSGLFGALATAFASGRRSLPIAAWLAPLVLLVFSRSLPPTLAMSGVAAALVVGIWFANRGVIPAPPPASAAIATVIALLSLLPYLADRLMAPRLSGMTATLVFPLALAAMDFAASRWSPYGTWGAVAHSQVSNLPLLQLAAFTGVPGIAFLVGWFASLGASMVQGRIDVGAVTAFAVVACSVMVLGAVRLAFSGAPKHGVRVAAIGWPEGVVTQEQLMRSIVPGQQAPDRGGLSVGFARINDHFVDATRREARAGAQIVVWPEANAMTFAEDEAALVERLCALARECSIHLVAGMAVVHAGSDRPFENKALLIDPRGQLAIEYRKAIPVPGFEARASRSGPRQLPSCDSPHGRLAVAICFDLDFPAYIRQAGRARADLLLVPASDWEAIKSLHFHGAVVRAIENGVPMVRATRWGWSGAVDAYGRLLARVDPFVDAGDVLITQVEFGHVPTLYSAIGDWFGWACVVAIIALTAVWT